MLLMEPGNKLQWNLNLNLYISIQENAFEKVVWEIDGHFVKDEMS